MLSTPVNSGQDLCTQITASTMPDFSISIAIVVTIPVHWAPAIKESNATFSYYNDEKNQTRHKRCTTKHLTQEILTHDKEIIYTNCNLLWEFQNFKS